MNRFISQTKEQEQKILEKLGKKTTSELFDDIPCEAKNQARPVLPEALSEYDLKKVMQNLAGRNISASDAVCFMGAGCYDHFIPSAVLKIASNATFALNSENINNDQTVLQCLYEYEQFMTRLTGMKKVSSVFQTVTDALREAVIIASKKKCGNIVVSRAVNPEYRRVLSTVAKAFGIEILEAKCDNGDTEFDGLVNKDTLAVIAQSPNFFGIIEDMGKIAEETHKNNALFIAIVDPLSLAVLSTPDEYDADIAIGNGQPLGGTLSYGAPFIAFMGVGKEMTDKIKNVAFDGENFSFDGKIEKTKAISATTSAAYLSVMGEKGIVDVAKKCYSNACYTYEKLTATTSFKPMFNKPFFREFAVKAVKKNVNDINNRMLDYGMIGGFALKSEYPELGNAWLVAVTEKRSADEVELFVKEASRLI